MDVNDVSLDSTTAICDSIRLTEFNMIQPYGCLIVLDSQFRVQYYSENISEILQTPTADILREPITHFLKSESPNESLADLLQSPSRKYKSLYWESKHGKLKIGASIHHVSGVTLLELEANLGESILEESTLDSLFQRLKAIQADIFAFSLDQISAVMAKEIKKISGYDRINIYKFLEQEKCGRVIGEDLEPDMDSFLGLQFPGNDIPKGVKEMYLNLPMRYIPSILDAPVSVLTAKSTNLKQSFDLSHCFLRSVAPIHAEYLINMKVVASTSIAIIYNKKLWGLIVCHHRGPKYTSLELRLVLMNIAQEFEKLIGLFEEARRFRYKTKEAELKALLLSTLQAKGSLRAAIHTCHDKLLEFFCVNGMSMYYEGKTLSYGETPTEPQLQPLIKWLEKKEISYCYSTSSLPSEFAESEDYKDKACGLLAIRIDNRANTYLLFYRPEYLYTIEWAGDPAQTIKLIHSHYSPRNSFKRHRENFSNHSVPWGDRDQVAVDFVNLMLAQQHGFSN